MLANASSKLLLACLLRARERTGAPEHGNSSEKWRKRRYFSHRYLSPHLQRYARYVKIRCINSLFIYPRNGPQERTSKKIPPHWCAAAQQQPQNGPQRKCFKLCSYRCKATAPERTPKKRPPRCIATVIYIEDVVAPRTDPKENAPTA
jgi:hypothetical protein